MAGIKLKIQGSFWLFLGGAVLLGKGYFAGMYALAVVAHECTHYLVASKLFYHCKQIQVGIFGAVLYGDFLDVTPSDRIKIALAGPLCNVTLCLCCLALWWILPDSYAFLQVFFDANASMAVVNLLPFYPLDGGRVFCGALEGKLGKNSLKIVKKVTVAFSLLLFALFVVSLFTRHNLFSLGLFAIFLFGGVFGNAGGEIYVKSTFADRYGFFVKNGMEKKTLVFDQNNSLRNVAKRMQGNFVYALEVVDDDMAVVATYSVAQLEKLVVTLPLDTKLSQLKKLI